MYAHRHEAIIMGEIWEGQGQAHIEKPQAESEVPIEEVATRRSKEELIALIEQVETEVIRTKLESRYAFLCLKEPAHEIENWIGYRLYDIESKEIVDVPAISLRSYALRVQYSLLAPSIYDPIGAARQTALLGGKQLPIIHIETIPTGKEVRKVMRVEDADAAYIWLVLQEKRYYDGRYRFISIYGEERTCTISEAYNMGILYRIRNANYIGGEHLCSIIAPYGMLEEDYASRVPGATKLEHQLEAMKADIQGELKRKSKRADANAPSTDGIALTEYGKLRVTKQGIQSSTLPEGIYVIPEGLFMGQKELTRVILPRTLRVIERGAFSCTPKLREIEIPSNLMRIGDKAFENAGGADAWLTFRNLGELASIGDKAFAGAYIERIEIAGQGEASTEVEIGEEVFARARIGEVHLGRGVVVIPNGMFRGARIGRLQIDADRVEVCAEGFRGAEIGNLEEVISKASRVEREGFAYVRKGADLNLDIEIELNDSLTYIGEGGFKGIVQLRKVRFKEAEGKSKRKPQAQAQAPHLDVGHILENIVIEPERTLAIESEAFAENVRMREIKLPQRLRVLGTRAFNGTSIRQLELPKGLVRIGIQALATGVAVTAVEERVSNAREGFKGIEYIDGEPESAEDIREWGTVRSRAAAYHAQTPKPNRAMPTQVYGKCIIDTPDGYEEMQRVICGINENSAVDIHRDYRVIHTT